jgi:hypothetical protein
VYEFFNELLNICDLPQRQKPLASGRKHQCRVDLMVKGIHTRSGTLIGL